MTALLNPRIIALVTVPVMALMFAVLLLMAEAAINRGWRTMPT